MTFAAEPPLLMLVFFGIVILPSKYKTAVPEPENDITLSFANPQSVYLKLPSTKSLRLKLPEEDNVGNVTDVEEVEVGLHESPLQRFPLEMAVAPLAERKFELEKTSEHCAASTLKTPKINNKSAVRQRNSIGNVLVFKRSIFNILYCYAYV